MPQFDYDATSIHFEEYGSGFPLLLIAPGAMESAIEMWAGATIDPLAHYADFFRLIAMDQRNAGRSYGPLEPSDPWGAYASDQLALLDHLGIGRFHVMGACIGASFALKLIERAPARVAAAVLEQPIGITNGNGPLYEQMWRSWGAGLSDRTDLTREGMRCSVTGCGGTISWSVCRATSYGRAVRRCSSFRARTAITPRLLVERSLRWPRRVESSSHGTTPRPTSITRRRQSAASCKPMYPKIHNDHQGEARAGVGRDAP